MKKILTILVIVTSIILAGVMPVKTEPARAAITDESIKVLRLELDAAELSPTPDMAGNHSEEFDFDLEAGQRVELFAFEYKAEVWFKPGAYPVWIGRGSFWLSTDLNDTTNVVVEQSDGCLMYDGVTAWHRYDTGVQAGEYGHSHEFINFPEGLYVDDNVVVGMCQFQDNVLVSYNCAIYYRIID